MRRALLIAALAVGLVPISVSARPAVGAIAVPPAMSHTPRQEAAMAYARMTTAQRLGQLFMAGVPSTGATRDQYAILRQQKIGNLILITDTTERRRSVKAVTASLTKHQTAAGVAPFISTDQEGGEVQRLTGKGFSPIPTALVQGMMHPSGLRAASMTWGGELRSAGVTLDLAPVADTVPAKNAKDNTPIGAFDREYGHTPSVVAPHVVAFVRGMSSAGVDTTLKHFPGLGRATGNTDTQRHVTDPTRRHSAYLVPFTDGVKAGARFVMVSSATYPNIDPHHLACFSKTIIGSMLRGDLKFRGVVISDDLGTPALNATPVGMRAVDFFAAGGTMLIDTTVSQIPAMTKAVVARMAASKSFAATIKAATLNVLITKAAAGLIKD